MVMMIAAGAWAITAMPSAVDPPSSLPVILVDVEWRGASAGDIEQLVTTPIEQELRTISAVREIRSRTNAGYVEIAVEFVHGSDMTIALDRVKQRVLRLRNLPSDIEPAVVQRFVDLEPVANVLVTAEGGMRELVQLVRSMGRTLLARGIPAVSYEGLPEEEIALLVGAGRLRELGLTLDELAGEVAGVSRNVPAGMIGRGQNSRQIRGRDQRRDVFGFEQLHIASDDRLVRLGDIAHIVRRPREGQPHLTSDGAPAIEIVLWRAAEDDSRLAGRILDTWFRDVVPTLPHGVSVTVYNDVWRFLRAQVRMIVENGVSGLTLVIAVLFLFLDARVGFWVMVGIPVSFFLSLVLLHGVFGVSVNIISLIGFVMALGIVVDDAIVVGEDVVTQFENGKSPTQAAIAGARRMWGPVMTSSVTTLAAFIPLLLIGGPLGDMILTLPTVLLCVMVASLTECFLVLPGHLRRALDKCRAPASESFRARFQKAFGDFREPLAEFCGIAARCGP